MSRLVSKTKEERTQKNGEKRRKLARVALSPLCHVYLI
jgi:hypothetical protein